MKKLMLKKNLAMPKKRKGGPSGLVRYCIYAGNLFGSVAWANGYSLATSRTFITFGVELFWSLQVYQRNFRKTLTKSHDYGQLFSLEKRRLKKIAI